VDWSGWAVFGVAATAALTALLIGAQMAGLTRLDIPLLLGTLFAEDADHARAVGFFLHLFFGQMFALGYALGFAVLDTATWWLGAVFGVIHVGVALTAIIPLLPGVHPRIASERAGRESRTVLEPPGMLALNYGRQTPIVATLAHVLYGLVLGILLTPS
jgi:hypothetical protein